MRTIVSLAVILGSFASAWAESACPGENKEAAWRLFQAKASKDPTELARAAEAFRVECGLPLAFWAGPKTKQKQKIEHPCGESVQVFVKAIPSPSDPEMQSEEVLEFGPAGAVIQRWSVPIDSVVGGVAGGELLILEEIVEEANIPPVYLAVSSGGTFRVVPFSSRSPNTSIACPPASGLPSSGYWECWKIVDGESGAERRFAYEGPCS